MKKIVLTVTLMLVVVLSLILVGCSSIRTVSNDLGFTAGNVSKMIVENDSVSKETTRTDKISDSFDIISAIELDKFDGDVLDSDWTDVPSYAIKFFVTSAEGHFEMRVIKKAPNTTSNETDKEIVLIGFRAVDGFDVKSNLEGFYTVADSQAFLANMAKIDVFIMSK